MPNRRTNTPFYGSGKAKAGMLALGRLKAGELNKAEAEYAAHLDLRVRIGEVLWYRYEALKLRLADSTFYTADFPIMLADRTIELHEVKGFWQDDARVKIKVAAEQYPMFKFVAIKKAKGGGWEREEF